MNAQHKAQIRTKLVSATGGVLLLVAVFMSVFFPWRQKKSMVHYMQDKVVAVAHLMAVNAEAGLIFDSVLDGVAIQAAFTDDYAALSDFGIV